MGDLADRVNRLANENPELAPKLRQAMVKDTLMGALGATVESFLTDAAAKGVKAHGASLSHTKWDGTVLSTSFTLRPTGTFFDQTVELMLWPDYTKMWVFVRAGRKGARPHQVGFSFGDRSDRAAKAVTEAVQAVLPSR